MKNKSTRTQLSTIIPVAALFVSSALISSANLIAYDTFDGYTNGQLVGQNQGFGWSGAWTGSTDYQVANSGGLSGTGGTANTGSTLTDGVVSISRGFSTTLPATGDIYYGFLMQQPAGNSPHGTGLNVSGGSGTGAWAGSWNATSNYELARVVPTNNYSNSSTGVAESNSTVFLVLKLELTGGADVARLYVNPLNVAALSGAGNTSFTFTAGANNFNTPTGLGFFRQNLNAADGNVSFDEIRVGTAAADMFTTIPEPSAALLGGLGLLGLLRRRRA